MSAAVAALLGWAGALTVVQGVAAARALRPRAPLPEGPHGAALVIRPCAGLDPSLAENLTSVARARWRGPVRVRFAVARADDPAAPVCERAAKSLRDNGIDALTVITGADAPNQKAAQLAAVIAREPELPRTVLIADSDTDLTDLPLGGLVARLEASPRVAAVWAPPVERSVATRGDRASRALLGASLHAFPLLAEIDAGGLVGKLVAIRADALAEAGGFDALVRHLGEDMELARVWRAAGWAIEVAPFVVPSTASGRSWDAAVARYARWMTVIRAQRAHLLPSYPLLFFGALPWTALALAAPSPSVALAAAGVWGARLAVVAAGARRAGARLSLKDIARADALLAASFARALRTRAVQWRGRALVIQRDGTLVEGAAR